MIFNSEDFQNYARTFKVTDERRLLLHAVMDQASERTVKDAQLVGEPTVFLRAAADCLVVMYFCRQYGKKFETESANSYWSLIHAHRRFVEGKSCNLH